MLLANRYRVQGNGVPAGELFLADQAIGPFFSECGVQLTARRVSFSVSKASGEEVHLASAADWRGFIDLYLRKAKPEETDRARAEALQDTLGIGLGSFVRLVEDLCASGLADLHVDFRKGTDAEKLLRLYESGEVYALIPDSAREDAFIKPRRGWPWRARIAPGDAGFVELEITPALYPRFILNAGEGLFGRDREEFEGHADFEPTDDAWSRFSQLATVQAWVGLDLSNLALGFWEDATRMSVLHRFNNPLHLEVDPTETPPYHINRERFIDVYIDTEARSLTKGKLSLRARVRDEQRRALVQYREEKPGPIADRIVRLEWERRIQSEYFGDTMPTLQRLVEIAQFGWDGGAPMPEARRLLQRLVDQGLHDRRKNLYLVPDLIIMQRRSRTNLQLDTVEVVRARLAQLTTMAAGLNPVPPELARFIGHVRSQLARMEAVSAILVRYAFRRMISGEAVLISQDRWAVFEPGAYAGGVWPTDFGDNGQRGRGIRLEAELDQNSSDQLELTVQAIQALIDQGAGDVALLEQERDLVKDFQESLFQDVKTTVDLQAARLRSAGLQEIHGLPYAKAIVGQAMVAAGQGGFRRGHRYWP